jgi:hypothetical protein
MKWFRLYDELLDDPKLQELPVEHRWWWLEFMCVASRQEIRGSLPALSRLAFHFRCSEDEAERRIKVLRKSGFIDVTPDGYKIHGWDERQFKSDDVTARTSKYKASQTVPRNVPANVLRNGASNVSRNDLRTVPGNAPEAEADTELNTAGRTADFSSHEEENAGAWREALNVLRSRSDTAKLADQIEASRDPRIPPLEGWRALVASHAMHKPGKKISKTVATWIRCAEVANGGDLDAIENPQRKPEPGVNGSLTNGEHYLTPTQQARAMAQPDPPPDPAQLRARLAEIEAIRRPNPIDTAEADSLRAELAKLETPHP